MHTWQKPKDIKQNKRRRNQLLQYQILLKFFADMIELFIHVTLKLVMFLSRRDLT
jgi:hypothetical protein